MQNKQCIYLQESIAPHCYGFYICAHYGVLFSEYKDDDKTYDIPDCFECEYFKERL